jgi:hypothetical protein
MSLRFRLFPQLFPIKYILLYQFQKWITDEVDKPFDDDIYQEVSNRLEYSEEPREIKDQSIDALNDLIEKLRVWSITDSHCPLLVLKVSSLSSLPRWQLQ